MTYAATKAAATTAANKILNLLELLVLALLGGVFVCLLLGLMAVMILAPLFLLGSMAGAAWAGFLFVVQVLGI